MPDYELRCPEKCQATRVEVIDIEVDFKLMLCGDVEGVVTMKTEEPAPPLRWMIYGANGYTGELIAREAARRGLRPVLAGRRRESVEALARAAWGWRRAPSASTTPRRWPGRSGARIRRWGWC